MDYAALAKELYDAGKAVLTVEFLSKRYPAMTWGDARGIARATDTLRAAVGDVHIG